MSELKLLPAPTSVVGADGVPLAGRFAGIAQEIDWSRLASPWRRSAWWRHFHHKRWQYVGLVGEDFFIGCAVVDVGWTNACFAYLFDRTSKQVTGSMSRDGIPGLTARVVDTPKPHSASRFSWLDTYLEYAEDTPGHFRLIAKGPKGFRLDAQLDSSASPPCLFASNAVQGGVWHTTHKSSALAVKGSACAGGKTYCLDGAWASLDHSNGLLPRNTQWLWASAHSAHVGFNLQSGYFGDNENALWLNGQLIPLAKANFTFDPHHTASPWTMRTDDGLLDLRFTPEGERREDRNLLVAASRYVQPVGTYQGTVRASPDATPIHIEGLLGVAEHHEAKW